MTRKDARLAFDRQKSAAKARGIGWELTFQQWVEWWGEDLERRGVGQFDLQMQRVADTGPYRLDNIRKGVPRDNAATRGRMLRKRGSDEAKRRIEAALDADPGTLPSYPDAAHSHLEGDEWWAHYYTGRLSSWLL